MAARPPARAAAPERELVRLRARGELAEWAPAGRAVRPGAWFEQAEPTPERIRLAVREGRFGDAAALGRHLVAEAQEIHDLYTEWVAAVPRILTRRGVPPERMAAAAKAAEAAVGDPGAGNPGADWIAFQEAVERFARGCERPGADHDQQLSAAIGIWRTAHDRHLGLVAWWIAFAVEELGENELGELWRELQAEGISSYERYDIRRTPWERSFTLLVQTAIEGMHGHLGGPTGRGEVEVRDHGDRVQLTFSPCGSGGRLRAAERFGSTSAPHDWAWNQIGVCHYCVHCCVLQQLEPIDNLGYPARVIDPPLAAGDSCSWTVYRDPAGIPESAYRRVGRRKPT